jgi:hypothetical protein
MGKFVGIPGALALCLLGGCQMLDSRWLNIEPSQASTGCQSNAGTYHLPRRLITVTVSGADTSGFGIKVDAQSATGAPYVSDRNETYCLDFLLSSLSADRVGIQRNEDGLLQRIYTQADDKSAEIAQDLIQAGADIVSSNQATLPGGRSFTTRPRFSSDVTASVVATFQFDPFVEREAREVNRALVVYGYCVYLDQKDDPFVPGWSQDICRELVGLRSRSNQARPQLSVVYKADPAYPRSGLPIFDPRPVPPELQQLGILYRPELTHRLVVIRKPDPGSRFSEWRPVASDRIVVPNAAPAFILEVKRAVFVKADTDVQFTNGLIKNISVNKPSELLAASNLAIAAAQIVTNIPKQALTIFNNRTGNTIDLINTNAQLIALLRDKATIGDTSAAAAQAQLGTNVILGRQLTVQGVPDQQQQLMQHCLEQGGYPEFCKSQILGTSQ